MPKWIPALEIGQIRPGMTWCIVFLSLLFLHCQYKSPTEEWQVIYKHNKMGEMVAGNKQHLIDAVRMGCDLRIGWGAKGESHTIEHCSTPI